MGIIMCEYQTPLPSRPPYVLRLCKGNIIVIGVAKGSVLGGCPFKLQNTVDPCLLEVQWI